MWCGVVWCGVVWCGGGVVWCGVYVCSVVWWWWWCGVVLGYKGCDEEMSESQSRIYHLNVL